MIEINRAAMRAGAHRVVALFGSGPAHPAAVAGLQYVAALDAMGGESFYAGDDPASELLGAVGVLQFMRARYRGPGNLGNASSVVVPLVTAMNEGLLPAGVLNAPPDPVPEPPKVVELDLATAPYMQPCVPYEEPTTEVKPEIQIHYTADTKPPEATEDVD